MGEGGAKRRVRARAPDLGVLGIQGPTSFESETRLFNCLRRHFRVGAERHPRRSEPTVGCTIRAAARPTPRQGGRQELLGRSTHLRGSAKSANSLCFSIPSTSI